MFQRFTERARRIILLAQEEAGMMNNDGVGTQHLLLGIVRENEGVAAQVLSKMGVSLAKVRQQIEAEAQPSGETSSGGEPKLTPKAKRVLELAADESRRMRHNYIGTEHLLLALLREKDGTAAQVLTKLGLNLEESRNQVMEYLGPEEMAQRAQVIARTRQGFDTTNELNVTLEVQVILRTAQVEAQQRSCKELNPDHLLLAILKDEQCAALLVGAGLDLFEARAALAGHLKADEAS